MRGCKTGLTGFSSCAEAKELGEGALHWILRQMANLIAFVIVKYEQTHKRRYP